MSLTDHLIHFGRRLTNWFGRLWVNVVLVFLGIVLYVTLPPVPSVFRELILVFTVILAVHVLERGVMWARMLDFHKESLREVAAEINPLVASALRCSLTMVYSDRHQSREALINSLNGAERRIWLLGIAFSQEVSFDELMVIVKRRKLANEDLDVKILLLDPFRSPAIFRTFLETSVPEVNKIISFDRSDAVSLDPLFRQTLYSNFRHAYDALSRVDLSFLKPDVRFYAHAPNCWLIVTDDSLYFEPYTFGRSQGKESEDALGPLMPVFRFDKVPDGRPFRVLEDHFWKVWDTSDVDLFHMQSRVVDQNRLVKDIFEQRRDWFNRVFGTLQHRIDRKRGKQDRASPRQSCQSDPPLTLKMNSGTSSEALATIVDSSWGGVRVRCDRKIPLAVNQIVRLRRDGPTPAVAWSKFLLKHIVNRDLEVRWGPDEKLNAGLRIKL